mmetsp:Transcript_2991/g.4857  ORF Transcript_2991/g.4857 Transcript_2991/m.4857 type:complete len:95 (-) Transcript_2991:135-419(-)
MVIRSTVSIMFVQNVDEIIFDSCCPDDIKVDLQQTRYHFSSVSQLFGVSTESYTWTSKKYVLFCHLPLLTVVCIGIVYGLRRDPDILCSHHFYW